MKKILFAVVLLLAINGIAQTPNYPFPHHSTYSSGTIKPDHYTQTQLDQQVKDFYTLWKAKYLKQGCVSSQYYIWYNDDGSNGNAITVSEAIGYGMVIMPLMAGFDANAKTYFDGLYNWYKGHPSSVNSTLMDWQQKKTGCASIGNDAATDGDIDAAFGLLLADKQWGSSGTINYLQAAKNIIGAIKASEVYTSNALQLGDWAHSSSQYKDGTRPSDFMFDHLRCFQQATNDSKWTSVLDKSYSLISVMQTNFSSTTGLIPDFIQHSDGTPIPAKANYLESKYDGAYNYNSCRVPWHLGCDFALNGDARAKTTCDKINAWIKNTAGNNSHNIRSGFQLNGSNLTGNHYEDLSFIAPFGVSAMVNSSNQAWLNNIWSNIIATSLTRDGYFGNTIKMICMITMSGNMWAPNHLNLEAKNTEALNLPNIGNKNVSISPNPCKGDLSVQYGTNKTGALNVRIINESGNVVYENMQHVQKGENNFNIHLNVNKGGVYFLLLDKEKIYQKISFLVDK